jgi:hypothetical protein
MIRKNISLTKEVSSFTERREKQQKAKGLTIEPASATGNTRRPQFSHHHPIQKVKTIDFNRFWKNWYRISDKKYIS